MRREARPVRQAILRVLAFGLLALASPQSSESARAVYPHDFQAVDVADAWCGVVVEPGIAETT